MKRIAEVLGRTLLWREVYFHSEQAALYDGDDLVLTARLSDDNSRLRIESGDGIWEVATSGWAREQIHLRSAGAAKDTLIYKDQVLTFADGRTLQARSNLTGWRYSVQQADAKELFVVDTAYELVEQVRIETDGYGANLPELPHVALILIGQAALISLTTTS